MFVFFLNRCNHITNLQSLTNTFEVMRVYSHSYWLALFCTTNNSPVLAREKSQNTGNLWKNTISFWTPCNKSSRRVVSSKRSKPQLITRCSYYYIIIMIILTTMAALGIEILISGFEAVARYLPLCSPLQRFRGHDSSGH